MPAISSSEKRCFSTSGVIAEKSGPARWTSTFAGCARSSVPTAAITLKPSLVLVTGFSPSGRHEAYAVSSKTSLWELDITQGASSVVRLKLHPERSSDQRVTARAKPFVKYGQVVASPYL